MQERKYKICSKTVVDTSVDEVTFDDEGVCNYARAYEERAKNELLHGKKRENALKDILHKIKRDGKGKKYDCIIGVSGGVDSSYVAYLVKQFGLNPLAVHFDNGWNSELAVANIEKLMDVLDIDLYTHVVNWKEFKDLQLSFIKSSIRNLEIPTDHALFALLYKMASKYGVKYVISGSNLSTEGIMPIGYGEVDRDLVLIKSIHRRFGKEKLKTYPMMGLIKFAYYVFVKRIRHVPILNYVDFNKEDAMCALEDKANWTRYGGKHYESIFTRFFQGYIQPVKYKLDKRRAHFSTLIMSGQMSRDEALEELKKNPYSDEALLNEDREYFIKKFDLTSDEFEEIMSSPVKSGRKDYFSTQWIFLDMKKLMSFAKRIASKI